MGRTSWMLAAMLMLAASWAAGREDSEQGWIRLFDGKTLNGWKASELEENWKVSEGAIVASGPRSHLFYIGPDARHPADFQDFHFKAEVMTRPNSNSGIYFHSKLRENDWPEIGHEAQVNNSYAPDPQRTGSLYNVVKNLEPPAEDNKWFTEEVIVRGKRIVIKVDGKTIVDYVEPDTVEGGRKLSHGTFALQAHDPGSTTLYRNILVKRLSASQK